MCSFSTNPSSSHSSSSTSPFSPFSFSSTPKPSSSFSSPSLFGSSFPSPSSQSFGIPSSSSPFASSGSSPFSAPANSPLFGTRPASASYSPFGSSNSSCHLTPSSVGTYFGSNPSSGNNSSSFRSSSSIFASTGTSSSSATSSLLFSSAPPFSASTSPSFPNLFGSSSSSSAFSASSTPAFSFSSSSTSSSVTASSISASSAPAFVFPGGSSSCTGSSVPAFSFPASSALTKETQAAVSGASSSPFSMATTMISATTPASATASSAASTMTAASALGFAAFAVNSSSSAFALVAAEGRAAASLSLPSIGTSTTAAFSGTTSSFSSISPCTKTAAATSLSQPQSTEAAPPFGTPVSFVGSCLDCSAVLFKVGIGDEEEESVSGEEEQVRDRIMKEPIAQMAGCEAKNKEFPGVGQDDNAERDCMKIKVAGVHKNVECAVAPTIGFVAKETVTIPGAILAAAMPMAPVVETSSVTADTPVVKSAAADVGVNSPGKEAEVGQEELSENLSVVSEVGSGVEIGAPGFTSQISTASSLFTDMNEFTVSPHNSAITKQILGKYGDITMGSILKSKTAKFTFLQLVADVVHRLCNHNLDTLDSNELQLLQTETADAVAVGFRLDWLQQRVNKVIAASKYQVRLMELDELGQKIDAAKKSLMEMELQQMVWKEEVASMKAEMEGGDLSGSNLCEGLL